MSTTTSNISIENVARLEQDTNCYKEVEDAGFYEDYHHLLADRFFIFSADDNFDLATINPVNISMIFRSESIRLSLPYFVAD